MAEIDDLLDARAKGDAPSGDDIDALLDAHVSSQPFAAATSTAQEETPWWKKAASVAGRQIGLAARANILGAAGLPLMAMDTGVALRDLSEAGTNQLAPGVAKKIYAANRQIAGVFPENSTAYDVAASTLPQDAPQSASNRPMLSWADINPLASTSDSAFAQGVHRSPSAEFSSGLTNIGLPEPKTTSEKVAGFIESVLAGSRVPAPQAVTQAPAGFVKPAASPSEQVLRDSLKEGYVVPPTTAKPTMINKLAEGFAGKISTAQAASIKNQEVTNELVRKAVGIQSGEPITPAALEGIRKAAGKVYEQIGNAGEIKPDAQYLDDLAQLGKSADEISTAFPGANVGATKQINEVVESLLQDKFDSKAALQYLRELRKQASGNLSGMNAADPAKQALGMAQREAASTLEDLIGRHLEANGMGDIAKSFAQARKAIAMSHSVENALNETTGNVIAGKLGQQLAKGKPLSGELETVAQFGRAFPKAAKEVTESMPGVSPLDWALAIGSAVGTGHVAPLAGVMARPGMRSALMSPWWQQSLTDAVPYAPQATIGLAPSAALQGGELARP